MKFSVLGYLGLLLGTALLIPPVPSRAEDKSRFEFLQIRMGIPVQIIVYAADSGTANQAASAAYARIRELDRIMSDYDPDSELMRLCAMPWPGEAQPVSEDLFRVLTASQELSEQSDGAFDITVGPVVKLWRKTRRSHVLPNATKLEEARQKVGYQKLTLDSDARRVSLQSSGMQLDLGAIAKGYAADEALKVLAEHGITQALVEAGGDLTAGDPPPGRSTWRVEVERLRNESSPAVMLNLSRQAVATSGDTYQYVEIDGQRYSHLVDPRTGLGLTTPSSVSVVAQTGMLADGLASAVSVLGVERGLALVEETPGAEALIVQLDDQGLRKTWQSSGWNRLVE